MTTDAVVEDFKLLSELLKTEYKDFPAEVQAQICRSFVDAISTDRRRPAHAQPQETNARIRAWCLSPDFANEFIARNKNRLVDALFEEEEASD